MSRLRAQPGTGTLSDLMLEYYHQRASNGGLILTEARRSRRPRPASTPTSMWPAGDASRMPFTPREATCSPSLWHAGRTTHITITGTQPVTASVDPTYWADPNIVVDTPDGFLQTSPHRALEKAEIAGILEQYRAAAHNAKKAGFDERRAHGRQWPSDFSRTTAIGGPTDTAVRSRIERYSSSRSSIR
jgi:N-ethylmaleimide reductase